MSAHGLVILVPEHIDAEPSWVRIMGGEITARGTGTVSLEVEGLSELPRDTRIMLVAPVGLANLHWTEFSHLTGRQGRAAARLLALDNSIGSAETLHIATADADDTDDRHNVAVVSRAQMAQWLLWAQHQGIDPDIVLPAALLLPHPDEGFVSGMIGAEMVIRGPDCAMAATDPAAPLIIGEAPVRNIQPQDIDRAAIAALTSPPLNLRQGNFSKRGKHGLDWMLVRKFAAMLGFIAMCSLLIAFILMMKYSHAADAVDAESRALARTVLPNVPDAETAQTQLDARLTEVGGGGLRFSGPAAGLYSALRNAPNVSISKMIYAADGTLRVTLSGSKMVEINPALVSLNQAGFIATIISQQVQGSQILADVTVRLP